jgi:hypothetical protein
MRTPILILGVMLIAGTVMYFMSRYQAPPAEYDTVNIENKEADIYQQRYILSIAIG